VHVAIESLQPGITVVRPQGTLDRHSVPAFHQILEAAIQRAERGLIVALADITCMDSAGLAVLIEGLKWSRGRALPYVLTHVTPAVQRMLELTRLEPFFPIASSVEEAARQCQRPVYALCTPPRPAPPAPASPAAAGAAGTEDSTRATGCEIPPRVVLSMCTP
jgi:anti-anti-sigma factor